MWTGIRCRKCSSSSNARLGFVGSSGEDCLTIVFVSGGGQTGLMRVILPGRYDGILSSFDIGFQAFAAAEEGGKS